MKKIGRTAIIVLVTAALLTGCAIGSGSKTEVVKPTLGQELVDLKNAKDSGAISEQEYTELKEKLKNAYE